MRYFVMVVAVAAALVGPVAGQTDAERMEGVTSSLMGWLDETESVLLSDGDWGLAIGLFGEGESKDIEFTSRRGQVYQVAGAVEDGTDIDLCVYDEIGREIDCDELDDAIPVVSFTAESTGRYTARLMYYDDDDGIYDGNRYAGIILISR